MLGQHQHHSWIRFCIPLATRGFFSIAIFSLLALGIPRFADAAALYWVGASGANTSVASNWKTTNPSGCGGGDAGAAPEAGDSVIFDSDCDNSATVNATFSVVSVTFNPNYIGTVTVSDGVAVTISDYFTQDGGTFVAGNTAMTIGGWLSQELCGFTGCIFTGGTGNITVGSTFDIESGGTFTAPSTNLYLKGDVITTFGTFNHNDGTVTFLADNNYSITATGTIFNDIVFDKSTSGTENTISLLSNFTVAGNLTAQNTNSSLGQLRLRGSSDPTITVLGNVSLPLTAADSTLTLGYATDLGTDDFNINLAGNLSLNDGNSIIYADITYDGTGTQTVSADFSSVYSDWTVNKTLGSVVLQDNIGTNANVTVTQGTFNVNGNNYTINYPATFTQTGGIFTGGSGDVTIYILEQSGGIFTAPSGTLAIALTFHRTAGTFTHNSGTAQFQIGSGDYTITTGGATFNHVIFDREIIGSNNTATLADDMTVSGNLTIQNSGSGGNIALQGTGAPTIAVAGNVTLPSTVAAETFTVGSLTAANNLTISTEGDFSLADSSVTSYANVTFNGASAQSITQSAGTLSGDADSGTWTTNKASGTATLATNLTLGGTASLVISQGTLATQSNDLTIATLNNSGTLQVQGDETMTITTMDTDSGTVAYAGSGTYASLAVGNTYYNLTISGSGSFTPTGTVDVNNTYTQSAGTFVAPSSMQVGGNFNHSAGTFTVGSGTVTLDGTDQTIIGSTTFYNLTKAVSTARTLTFTAGTTQTVTGALTLTGQSGALLSLRSSSTGSQWKIDALETSRTLTYLDVKDSNNIHATVMDCRTGCTDSGNNINWNFGSPTATTPTNISQDTDGTGYVSFKTTVNDADRQTTQLKVQYSLDNNTFKDLTLVAVSASEGDLTLDNNNAYQIQGIDTTGDAVTVMITWDSKAELGNAYVESVYLRVIPNDGTGDGAAATSNEFSVDNAAPDVSALTTGVITTTTVPLAWSADQNSEVNFRDYRVCYGTSSTSVAACGASIWGSANDTQLTKLTTVKTTLAGLNANTTYVVRLEARDTFGNVAALTKSGVTTVVAYVPTLTLETVGASFGNLSWNSTSSTTFTTYELCYGQNRALVDQTTCGADSLTFTAASTASGLITDLLSLTTYYAKLFVHDLVANVAGSNIVTMVTTGGSAGGIIQIPSPQPIPPAPPEIIAPLPELLPPTPATPGVVETVTETIAQAGETVADGLRAFLAMLAKQPLTSISTTLAAIGALSIPAAAIALFTTAIPAALTQLPYVVQRAWHTLLGFFGARPRRRTFGRVINADDGTPIAGALVQIFDRTAQKLKETVATNDKGLFASYVPAGTYEFRVHKPGWTLSPTAEVRLKSHEHIWDGKPLVVSRDRVLSLVLALRQLGVAPVPHHRFWLVIFQNLEHLLAHLSWPLLLGGALINTIALLLVPSWFNGTIEGIYAVLIIAKLYIEQRQQRASGQINDAVSNRPVDLATVRLYDAATNRLIATRVTNRKGQFLLLPSAGVYTMVVARDGYEAYRESHIVFKAAQRTALNLHVSLSPAPLRQMTVGLST